LPTLLHIAARVIRVHKIPYADGETPTNLHSLLELRNLRLNNCSNSKKSIIHSVLKIVLGRERINMRIVREKQFVFC